MPVYIEALEGVSDGVFYVGDMEHYYEVGDSMNNAKLALNRKLGSSITCVLKVKKIADIELDDFL